MNRQERRKQEKIPKKENKTLSLEMSIDLLQPWSVPVMRTRLPLYVLDRMLEISEGMISDENSISHGPRLAGQIKTELTIDTELLKKNDLDKFFDTMIKQFVILAKTQKTPYKKEEIQKETWLSQMDSMWVISQKPGEYNPIHFHTECQISAVMYLKLPKFLPSEKKHRAGDDGAITFVSNSSKDKDFSDPTITIRPFVGDFFIFGANQLHSVNPYKCEEGDSERRSVSFNANFMSQTDYYNEQKKKEMEKGYS